MDTQAYVSQARSFWLARVSFKSELSLLEMWAQLAIPANQYFPLKTSATTHTQSFLPQLWLFSRFSLLSVRVSSEKREERRVTRKKGRSSENNLIRTAMVQTTAPDEPGVRFLPSLIPYSLTFCCLFLLFFIPEFLTSSFLPFYIPISLSLSRPKRQRVSDLHARTHTRERARKHPTPAHTHARKHACTHIYTHAHANSHTHTHRHKCFLSVLSVLARRPPTWSSPEKQVPSFLTVAHHRVGQEEDQ